MPDDDETVIPRLGTKDVKKWAKLAPLLWLTGGAGVSTGAFSNFDFMGNDSKNQTIANQQATIDRCRSDLTWTVERNESLHKALMQSLGVDLGASFVPPTPGMFWIDEPELVQ